MSIAAYIILAYLIGAFPSAVVLGRLIWRTDVRKHGSGNAGATNAWRVLGWKAGLSVLILDAGKGALAAGVIPYIPLGGSPLDTRTLAIICGMAAVVGHVFPIYTKFRGGKGVATAAGMLAVVAPIPVGFAVGVFAAAILASGIVSLGSILAAWALPISAILLSSFARASYPPLLFALTLALALFITYTHRKNIARLLKGEERSFPQLRLWKRRG